MRSGGEAIVVSSFNVTIGSNIRTELEPMHDTPWGYSRSSGWKEQLAPTHSGHLESASSGSPRTASRTTTVARYRRTEMHLTGYRPHPHRSPGENGVGVGFRARWRAADRAIPDPAQRFRHLTGAPRVDVPAVPRAFPGRPPTPPPGSVAAFGFANLREKERRPDLPRLGQSGQSAASGISSTAMVSWTAGE